MSTIPVTFIRDPVGTGCNAGAVSGQHIPVTYVPPPGFGDLVPTAPPSAPVALPATGQDEAGNFVAHWEASEGATGYSIDVICEFLETTITTELGAVTSFATNVDPGFAWMYRLRAFNAAGFSDYSNTVNVVF